MLPAHTFHAAEHAHGAALEKSALAYTFEHLPHLRVLAQELIDLLHAGSGAGGDALAAAAGDDLMVVPLFLRHRVDDGFDPGELLLVDLVGHLLHTLEGSDGGQHFHDALQGTKLADLAELVAEIFEGESVAAERLSGKIFRFLAVERLFGLLDERHNIAHTENAADDAVGMEGLEGVRLFAHTDELDRLAGHMTDGQRSTTARITVHLGKDDAGESEALVELLG
jgi:hypothetical protein